MAAASIQKAKLKLFNMDEIFGESFCINAFWQSSLSSTVGGNMSVLELGSLSRVEVGSVMDKIHVLFLKKGTRLTCKTRCSTVDRYSMPRAKRACVGLLWPQLPPWATAAAQSSTRKHRLQSVLRCELLSSTLHESFSFSSVTNVFHFTNSLVYL